MPEVGDAERVIEELFRGRFAFLYSEIADDPIISRCLKVFPLVLVKIINNDVKKFGKTVTKIEYVSSPNKKIFVYLSQSWLRGR